MQGKKIVGKPNLANLKRPEMKPGELVWATWGPDQFLYPALITEAKNDSVLVVYLDGDESEVLIEEVFLGDLELGTLVSVNYKGRGKYYFGHVVSKVGMAIEIDYEDGDHGMTTLAQVRLPLTGFLSTQQMRSCEQTVDNN
jgi:hypothetical protein